MAKGSIGRLDELNFMIDTGALPSVVSSRVVKELKLQGIREQLSVFTRDVSVQRVVIPDVALGPIHLQAMPALARNLDFIQRQTGVRVDAVIGLNVLGRCNLAIDYKTRKMIFGTQVSEEPGIPLEVGPGCMLVLVRFGDCRLRLMVDTRAKHLMLFESRFRSHFPNLRPSGRSSGSEAGAVAGHEHRRSRSGPAAGEPDPVRSRFHSGFRWPAGSEQSEGGTRHS